MVFICGQRKPEASALRDFFFPNGYVNYLTSVIGKLSQTNLPLSLCFSCRGVKIHFLRLCSEKLRRQSPPLADLWDGTSASFTSLLIPTWTPFGSYTRMSGARMLQDLLCGTEHLLTQPREQSSEEKGSTTVPKCSAPTRKLWLPWKIPVSLEAAEHESEQWEVKWSFIFKQQCLLMYLVPDK